MKKLYKSVSDRRICGVCGGLAEYLNVDPTLVRIIVTVLFFAGSLSFWVYLIAAIVIPDEPTEYFDNNAYGSNGADGANGGYGGNGDNNFSNYSDFNN